MNKPPRKPLKTNRIKPTPVRRIGKMFKGNVPFLAYLFALISYLGSLIKDYFHIMADTFLIFFNLVIGNPVINFCMTLFTLILVFYFEQRRKW